MNQVTEPGASSTRSFGTTEAQAFLTDQGIDMSPEDHRTAQELCVGLQILGASGLDLANPDIRKQLQSLRRGAVGATALIPTARRMHIAE